MDLTKLPKDLREKYEDKVLDKAIEKTDYDLAKHNKSQDDISEQKYESMVARNIEVNNILSYGDLTLYKTIL